MSSSSSTTRSRFTGTYSPGEPGFGATPTGPPVNIGQNLGIPSASGISTGLTTVNGRFSGIPTPGSINAARVAPANEDAEPQTVTTRMPIPLLYDPEDNLSFLPHLPVISMGGNAVTPGIVNKMLYSASIGQQADWTSLLPQDEFAMYEAPLLAGVNTGRVVSLDTHGVPFMGADAPRATSPEEADELLTLLGTIRTVDENLILPNGQLRGRPSIAVNLQGYHPTPDYWAEKKKKHVGDPLLFMVKWGNSPFRETAPGTGSNSVTAELSSRLGDPSTPMFVPYLGDLKHEVSIYEASQTGYVSRSLSSHEEIDHFAEWRTLWGEGSSVYRAATNIFDGIDEKGNIKYREGDLTDADDFLVNNVSPGAVFPLGTYLDGYSATDQTDFQTGVFPTVHNNDVANMPFNDRVAATSGKIRVYLSSSFK